MSQLNDIKNIHLPDTVYFDILSTNFESTITPPKVFTYNESRSNPFVENPEHYDLSILRFTVDTGTLPLFIPSITPNQSNKDKTIYSVSMVQTDVVGGVVTELTDVYQQFITWIPQDKSAAPPLAPISNPSKIQDNNSGYYNCYSYEWFLFLVYSAMDEALTNLKLDAGYVPPVGTVFTPIIKWDPATKTAIIQGQQNVFNAQVSPQIKLFFNAPLFELFSSFPSVYIGYDSLSASDGRNFQIVFPDIGGSNVSQVFPDGVPDASTATFYNVINVYQEYSTISAWSPITSIVFTSNTLPIEPNQVSTPIVFDNGVPLIGGTPANVENIITDIATDNGLYRPNIVYVPSAEYRRIHLYGNRPLHNIDLNIYYRLKTGVLVPFRLASGGSITIKLAFLKKARFLIKT
jgi:hypothetical protein